MNDRPREDRLRRMARDQGYWLTKIRRRDPQAPDYGRYRIVDPSSNTLPTGSVHDGNSSLSLDEVEKWLSSRRAKPTAKESRQSGNAFNDPVQFVQEGLAAGAAFERIASYGKLVDEPSGKTMTGPEIEVWYSRELELRAKQ